MSSAVLGVLVLVVGLHLLLTFALIARVRALQAMISPSLAPLPKPGTPIGDFEAETADGERLSHVALRDATTLVGFFSADCPHCEQARGALLASPPTLPLVAFVRGSAADPGAARLADALAPIARVAYTTATDPAYRAFAPTGFPSLYRVENGRVAVASHQLGDVLR